MKEHIKRLGILCIYDESGTVDDYVTCLLNDMLRNLDRLIIVCNGILSFEGREKLGKFTNEIICRHNIGFDAGAWQNIIVEYLKPNELEKYDQLVLFNDTFYGPFYPFKEVFDIMDEKSFDFWGLTIHSKTVDDWGLCPYGYLPEHLQSYFIVFSGNVLRSQTFLNWWKGLREITCFEEAVCYNEACLTKYFADAGYSYGALCDTRGIDKEYGVARNYYAYAPKMLLERYRWPVLKRKTVLSGFEWKECAKWISENSAYDLSLIEKNADRYGGIQDSYLNNILFKTKRYIKCHLPHKILFVLRRIKKLLML